ncbi:MAG: hypothetical protein AB1646_17390 [Thermodesulfobacteriota bacterium]
MKEVNLRIRHRQLGMVLALFLVLQAATGLLLSTGLPTGGAGHAHGEQAAGTTTARPTTEESHGHGEADTHETPHAREPGPSPAIILMTIHHGGGTIGTVYRVLLATGIVVQALLGVLIFFKIRSRSGRGGSGKPQRPPEGSQGS